MAELPGWDRDRLATAAPSDVAAARWLIYARARRPEIRRDIAGEIDSIRRQDDSPARREIEDRVRRRDALTALADAQRHQANLRGVLGLDDEDL